jgi:hypothetical protein
MRGVFGLQSCSLSCRINIRLLEVMSVTGQTRLPKSLALQIRRGILLVDTLAGIEKISDVCLRYNRLAKPG